jgi:hypothetical protein
MEIAAVVVLLANQLPKTRDKRRHGQPDPAEPTPL